VRATFPLLLAESLGELFAPVLLALGPLAQLSVHPSLAESPTCCLSVASLVGGIADDGSEPVPRSHRGGLRGVLRAFAMTSRAVIADGAL
jgi:hypothetical protein